MITFGDTALDLNDPVVLLTLAGFAALCLIAVLLILALRAAGRGAGRVWL